jgi:hypothetical protein
MQYVCDAGAATWFRLETPAEAAQESRLMNHAVERFFRDAEAKAVQSYMPPPGLRVSEQNIGLKAHIARVMPRFLTLRNGEGTALVTAMLPPAGVDATQFKPILVGADNADPYRDYQAAITALAQHCRLTLDPDRCYPYRRE